MQTLSSLSQIPQPLLSWYDTNHRILPWREPIVPYHTWVSEIMLQQTRVEAVIDYYHRFLTELPDIESLANAEEQKLLKLWEGLGYYNRVRNMQKAAKQLMEHHNGELPADIHTLQSLSGIGSYTAGAIASIAFSLPVPAVDGNVLRVLSRVLGSEQNISKATTKRFFEQELTVLLQTEPAHSQVGDFNQALMELGALVCIPNGQPNCLACPLSSFCVAYQEKRIDSLPIKDEKKARTIETKTFLLYQSGNHFALQKRADSGLLASMWEFPWVSDKLTLPQLKSYLKEQNQMALSISKLPKAKHIFSHIEWHMTGFLIELDSPFQDESLVWVTKEEMEQTYPLPGALDIFRNYIAKIATKS